MAAMLGLLAASCGGGVDSGGTGGSMTSGPIDGLGSIILNGIRFDDSTAQVADDEGNTVSRERLKLGAFVFVEGSRTSTAATGRQAAATRVLLSSDLIGEVQSIDRVAGTFTLLAQTVRVTSATVFDDRLPLALASLDVGAAVEVYGRVDVASGQYVATRIEPRQPGVYSVRGRIDALDAGARTARIGALLLDTSALSAAEAAQLAVGVTARLRLASGAQAATWRVLAVAPAAARRTDSEEGSVEGRISSFASAASFSVDGQAVDASKAAFPQGSAGLKLGARVAAEGPLRAGVLVATTVRVERDEDDEPTVFELHGPIESLDRAATLFVVKGVSIDYSGNVQFENGTAADLAPGRLVAVHGKARVGAVGLAATEIEFESN